VQSLASWFIAQLLLAAPAALPAVRPTASPQAATSPAQPADLPAARPYRDALAEYQQLGPAARLEYDRRLVTERLEPAATIALDEAGLARQREINREILDRLGRGETIPARGLFKLLRRLDVLEQAAIERLAHNYRVEVYSRFHSQPAEYDARNAAWKRALQGWEAAGSSPLDRHALIDWLRMAIAGLRADRLAELPPPPTFADRAGANSVQTGDRLKPESKPSLPRAPRPGLEPTPDLAGRRRASGELPELAHRNPPADAPHSSAPQGTLSSVTASSVTAQRPVSAALADNSPGRSSDARPLERQPRQPHTAMRPIAQVAELQHDGPVADSAGHSIDLDELAVRIAGHNLALARLSGRLQDKELWTADQLAAGLAELEELTARRQDLLLYWELVAKRERSTVRELHSTAPAVALLGAKIIASRLAFIGHQGDTTAIARGGAGGLAARTDEFDRLSRRLAQLAHER
jgi:hypothetical protein